MGGKSGQASIAHRGQLWLGSQMTMPKESDEDTELRAKLEHQHLGMGGEMMS